MQWYLQDVGLVKVKDRLFLEKHHTLKSQKSQKCQILFVFSLHRSNTVAFHQGQSRSTCISVSSYKFYLHAAPVFIGKFKISFFDQMVRMWMASRTVYFQAFIVLSQIRNKTALKTSIPKTPKLLHFAFLYKKVKEKVPIQLKRANNIRLC